MTDPAYGAMPHDQVAAQLGSSYPPAPGAQCLAITAITDGWVAVYPVDGQPGKSFWVIDSYVPPQTGCDLDWLAAQLGQDPPNWVVPVPAPTEPDAPPTPGGSPHPDTVQ